MTKSPGSLTPVVCGVNKVGTNASERVSRVTSPSCRTGPGSTPEPSGCRGPVRRYQVRWITASQRHPIGDVVKCHAGVRRVEEPDLVARCRRRSRSPQQPGTRESDRDRGSGGSCRRALWVSCGSSPSHASGSVLETIASSNSAIRLFKRSSSIRRSTTSSVLLSCKRGMPQKFVEFAPQPLV